MVYETINWITASLQRMLLQGRPGSRLSLPKAFFPAFTWLPASGDLGSPTRIVFASPFVISCKSWCVLDPLGQVSPCYKGSAVPTHRDLELFLHHLPQTLEEPSHLQDAAHSSMSMEMLMCERKPPARGGLYPTLTQSVCLCMCVHACT